MGVGSTAGEHCRRWLSRTNLAGALCFLAGVAFVPGLPGAAISPRWAILLLTLPWLVASIETAGAAARLLLALLAWSAFSLAWSPLPYDGVDALLRLCCFAGAVWLGASLTSLTPAIAGFAAALVVNCLVFNAQLWGWNGIEARFHGAAGLFVNPHALAELAALVLVALVALAGRAPSGGERNEWIFWALCIAAPALLTGSRAALLAIAAGLATALPRRLQLAVFAAALAGAGALTFSGWRIASLGHRLALWRDTLDGIANCAGASGPCSTGASVFAGQGLGTWYGLYPLFATRTDILQWREAHAHNDLLELAFDLGLVGAILAAGFAAAALGAGLRAVRLGGRDPAAAADDKIAFAVFAAFLVEGLVSFPLHMPATALLAGLAAGRLCGARHQLRRGAAPC